MKTIPFSRRVWYQSELKIIYDCDRIQYIIIILQCSLRLNLQNCAGSINQQETCGFSFNFASHPSFETRNWKCTGEITASCYIPNYVSIANGIDNEIIELMNCERLKSLSVIFLKAKLTLTKPKNSSSIQNRKIIDNSMKFLEILLTRLHVYIKLSTYIIYWGKSTNISFTRGNVPTWSQIWVGRYITKMIHLNDNPRCSSLYLGIIYQHDISRWSVQKITKFKDLLIYINNVSKRSAHAIRSGSQNSSMGVTMVLTL